MASRDSKELGMEMQDIDTEPRIGSCGVAGTNVPTEAVGTAYDQRDMRVMGKPQQLRVRDLFMPRCVSIDTYSETSASPPF
jgi:hypothetical protein